MVISVDHNKSPSGNVYEYKGYLFVKSYKDRRLLYVANINGIQVEYLSESALKKDIDWLMDINMIPM